LPPFSNENRAIMGSNRIRYAVGSLLGLVAGVAVAQVSGGNPASEGPAPATTLPRVNVREDETTDLALEQESSASRLNLTVLETPAAVEVISGDAIRERGDISVVDAITRAAGVTDSSSPGNGSTAVTARGFSRHGSVMQLFDGTRFYVGAGTLTFPFDTWSIDRIEILHGPASVLHGEGALGGAVNIIPKKPTRSAAYDARVSIADDQTYRLGLGAGGALTERLSYRTDLSYGRGDGWMDDGEFENLSVSAAARFDVSDSLAVTLSHDHGEQQPQHYFGVPLVNGRLNEAWRENNYNVTDARIRYQDELTRLRLEWAATERFSVSNETYYLRSDRDWRNAETYRWQAASGLVQLSDFLELGHRQTQRGNRSNAVWASTLFGLDNQVSFGFEVNEIDFTHINNNTPSGPVSLTDAWNPGPSAFINLAGTLPRYRTDSRQYSLFAENQLHLTTRWTLVGGVRYDNIEVERTDLMTPAASFTKDFEPTHWRLGTVFSFTPTLVAYGQYATNAGHLGSLITMSATQVAYDLSTSEQWEVGLKQSLSRGEWTLAAYDITRRKILSRDPENPSITQQIGQQSSRGIELNASMRLLPGLSANANAAVLEARFDDFVELVSNVPVSRNGNVPSGIPRQTANLWLSWEFRPDWKANAGWRYVGERYSDTANLVRVADYQSTDLSVSWRPTNNLRLTARLDNLFDDIYTTSSSTSQWRLAPPRTLSVWADVSL
jgi:iron complex outermembrane recepter protein